MEEEEDNDKDYVQDNVSVEAVADVHPLPLPKPPLLSKCSLLLLSQPPLQ